MFNFCLNGLFTVDERGFLSRDKWLWNLQPEDWVVKRFEYIQPGDTILTCSLSELEASIVDSMIIRGKLEIIYEGQGFRLFRSLGRK